MGELAGLAAALLWAVATLIFTVAGTRLPPTALNLLKTGIAFVALAVTAWLVDGRPFAIGLDPTALGWVAVSGVLGLTLGDTLYFASLRLLGARRSLILWALTPATTALLADWILGEAVNATFFTGLALTSVGVALVLADRTPATRGAVDRAESRARVLVLGVLVGLGAVLCQAGGSVTAKLGGVGLTGLELSVVRLGFGTLALLIPGAWALRRSGGDLDRKVFLQVSFGTFVGTYLGLWVYMYALQNAYAGVVATLSSTSPIFVLPIARLVFGERVGPLALLGATLAVGGVAVLTLTP